MTDTLADFSLVATYSAIAVYVLAFIAYVMDLSARASTSQAAKAAATGHVEAQAGSGSVAVAEKTDAPAGAPTASRWQRVGFALTIIGVLVHAGALVLRGIAAGRVPWANMYEFALMGTFLMMAVYLVANIWKDIRFLGAYLTGLVSLLLAFATVNFYVAVSPLPPPLQSAWLVIHVFVATLSSGFFAVGGGLAVVQLVQTSREHGGWASRFKPAAFLRTFPTAETVERISSRLIIVGFAFWTFTLMAGAIWAEKAWGRYWGWDTKEVWTFIIWVVFAGYIHARVTKGWRGTRSAWLAIIGFVAVLFNFTVVNLFFHGLHAYSGLTTATY